MIKCQNFYGFPLINVAAAVDALVHIDIVVDVKLQARWILESLFFLLNVRNKTKPVFSDIFWCKQYHLGCTVFYSNI